MIGIDTEIHTLVFRIVRLNNNQQVSARIPERSVEHEFKEFYIIIITALRLIESDLSVKHRNHGGQGRNLRGDVGISSVGHPYTDTDWVC